MQSKNMDQGLVPSFQAPKELVKPIAFETFLQEEQDFVTASTKETMKRCSSSNVCGSGNSAVNSDTDLLF